LSENGSRLHWSGRTIKLEDQAAKAKLLPLNYTPGVDGNKLRLGVIDLRSFYAPFDFPPGLRPPRNLPKKRTDGPGRREEHHPRDVLRLINKLKEEKSAGNCARPSGINAAVVLLRRPVQTHPAYSSKEGPVRAG